MCRFMLEGCGIKAEADVEVGDEAETESINLG